MRLDNSLIPVPHVLVRYIFIGLMLRIPFLPVMGFEQDFLFFTSWANGISEYGLVHIYDDPERLSVKFINYPPLYLYILAFLERFYHIFFSGSVETRFFLVLMKVVTIAFELLSALILYHWISKKHNERTGLQAFLFYFLNPAIFYVSVYYGQVDAIFAAFLLFAVMALLAERLFWSGFFMALSLLMKLQAIPFVPLLFFIPFMRGDWRRLIHMGIGFAAAFLIVLFPFIVAGRVDEMYHNCVEKSVAWGKYITVGAFNIWYLHADPITLDQRIWGWLYGPDGMVQSHFVVHLLTYKNLGVGLFGMAFLWSLFCLWRKNDEEGVWLAVAHVALAFYLLPTKVHERYLFPFFLMYIPLILKDPLRRMLFYGFSVTYLVNVMVICPLIGEIRPVEQIDSIAGVFAAVTNLVLYCLFLVYETGKIFYPRVEMDVLRKTLSVSAVVALALFLLRIYERQPHANMLYLTQIQPVSVKQDWPPIDDSKPLPPGYFQVMKDLSIGDEVQRTLRLRDTLYRYGLGAHALSRVEYLVPEGFDYFDSYIGVDAEVLQAFQNDPSVASVSFAVWINDELRYRSPLMIPTSLPERVILPLPKGQGGVQLRLEVDSEGSNHSDHANWALARIVRGGK